MDDPNEFCGCCKYFVPDYANPRGQSECHRHAPVATPQPDGQAWTYWPAVGEAEYCGDFVGPPEPELKARAPYKCKHCHDGEDCPADATDWICPKCGANCMPF